MGLFSIWVMIKESTMPENAQDKEEFLRDVIAIIQGQPSPEFYSDQNTVNMEVKKLLSMIQPNDLKAKRILLKQLEVQWKNTKELAVAWANRKVVQ